MTQQTDYETALRAEIAAIRYLVDRYTEAKETTK